MTAGFFPLITLLFVTFANNQTAPAPNAPHLQPGVLSTGLYLNEELGVRLPIPEDWEGKLSSGDGSLVDPAHPDSLLNRCSQVLVSRQKFDDGTGFKSSDVLFVMNPACFEEGNFPKSYADRDQIAAFVTYLIKIFRGTVYIPPSGVDYGADHTPQHTFIRMVGAGLRGADGDKGGKQIHVYTGVTVTSSGGYWLVWAGLLDDKARKQPDSAKLQLRED